MHRLDCLDLTSSLTHTPNGSPFSAITHYSVPNCLCIAYCLCIVSVCLCALCLRLSLSLSVCVSVSCIWVGEFVCVSVSSIQVRKFGVSFWGGGGGVLEFGLPLLFFYKKTEFSMFPLLLVLRLSVVPSLSLSRPLSRSLSLSRPSLSRSRPIALSLHPKPYTLNPKP
jgi:hypothetical protein